MQLAVRAEARPGPDALRADGTMLGSYATPEPDQLHRFDFPSRVASTPVRVEAITTTGGNTGVKEVELYEAP